MAKVNRNSLRSNYQNKGDVYDDVKTEAVFEALADQIDTNDQELVDYKTKLASIMDGGSGAHAIGSATINGVVGNSVFAQISDLKNQINESALGQIPNGSIDPIKLSAATKSAVNITVADANAHFTATNVEGVLDELFTFANDGKTAIASVVGSPATSGDSFSLLQTHIQDSKNTLATNLTNRGQASDGTETLSALVNKVANVNTGKRFAQGSQTFTYTSGTQTLTITGLAFRPKFVIATFDTNGAQNFILWDSAVYNLYGTSPQEYDRGGTSATPGTLNQAITNDGFTFQYQFTGGTIRWLAFE